MPKSRVNRSANPRLKFSSWALPSSRQGRLLNSLILQQPKNKTKHVLTNLSNCHVVSAQTTMASLELNAIRLTDYLMTRCRTCMANALHSTKHVYEKLDQIWSWTFSRFDKLADDYTTRARQATRKVQRVDASCVSSIIGTAVVELR